MSFKETLEKWKDEGKYRHHLHSEPQNLKFRTLESEPQIQNFRFRTSKSELLIQKHSPPFGRLRLGPGQCGSWKSVRISRWIAAAHGGHGEATSSRSLWPTVWRSTASRLKRRQAASRDRLYEDRLRVTSKMQPSPWTACDSHCSFIGNVKRRRSERKLEVILVTFGHIPLLANRAPSLTLSTW